MKKLLSSKMILLKSCYCSRQYFMSQTNNNKVMRKTSNFNSVKWHRVYEILDDILKNHYIYPKIVFETSFISPSIGKRSLDFIMASLSIFKWLSSYNQFIANHIKMASLESIIYWWKRNRIMTFVFAILIDASQIKSYQIISWENKK